MNEEEVSRFLMRAVTSAMAASMQELYEEIVATPSLTDNQRRYLRAVWDARHEAFEEIDRSHARAETAEAQLAEARRLLKRFASHLGAGLSNKTGDNERDCIYCDAKFVMGKRGWHNSECPILKARAFLES